MPRDAVDALDAHSSGRHAIRAAIPFDFTIQHLGGCRARDPQRRIETVATKIAGYAATFLDGEILIAASAPASRDPTALGGRHAQKGPENAARDDVFQQSIGRVLAALIADGYAPGREALDKRSMFRACRH